MVVVMGFSTAAYGCCLSWLKKAQARWGRRQESCLREFSDRVLVFFLSECSEFMRWPLYKSKFPELSSSLYHNGSSSISFPFPFQCFFPFANTISFSPLTYLLYFITPLFYVLSSLSFLHCCNHNYHIVIIIIIIFLFVTPIIHLHRTEHELQSGLL